MTITFCPFCLTDTARNHRTHGKYVIPKPALYFGMLKTNEVSMWRKMNGILRNTQRPTLISCKLLYYIQLCSAGEINTSKWCNLCLPACSLLLCNRGICYYRSLHIEINDNNVYLSICENCAQGKVKFVQICQDMVGVASHEMGGNVELMR